MNEYERNIKRRMQLEYFEYNGKVYRLGTKFKLKINSYGAEKIVDAYFHSSAINDNSKILVFYRERWDTTLIGINIPKDKTEDYIVEILPGNYYDEVLSSKKYVKDSNDSRLGFAWVIYIATMLLFSIVNGRLLGWIGLTVYFVVWRHLYKEENCAYYE